MPCASKPKMNPPSTSPAPAVANVAGAFELIMARPSGAAMTVSAPFKHDHRAARARRRACARQLVARRCEQAREFALMRREHAGASYRLEEFPRSIREHTDGIGVEHHGTSGCEHFDARVRGSCR